MRVPPSHLVSKVQILFVLIKNGGSKWNQPRTYWTPYNIYIHYIIWSSLSQTYRVIVFKQPTIGVFTFGVEFWKKLCSFLLGNRLRWMDSAHFKSYYSFTQMYFIPRNIFPFSSAIIQLFFLDFMHTHASASPFHASYMVSALIVRFPARVLERPGKTDHS